MRNVYLALKRSVGLILLLFSFVAQTNGNTPFSADTTAPAISTFSPTSGQKGTFVTIFGSNFVSATAVRFGGVLADSIVFKNDTVIVAIVDTGATGNVSVITPFGTASKPGFTFIRDTIPDTTAAPVIINFTPTSGRKGTTVGIFGSNFTGATAVRFGGVLADTILFKNDTVIVAVVDTGATGNVTVTTPFGTASKSGFTFIRDTTSIPDTARPVIVAFSPTSARKGTVVTIFGSHFTGATAVRFGNVLASSATILSDTVIQAVVGTGSSGFVTVTSPKGIGYRHGFTFIADTTNIPDTTAPVITSFTPTSGKKGTMVTIFGSHLTGVFAVRFGGVSADSIVVLSDTVMQAIVDTGATGNVTIFKGFRSATKAGFTFIKDTTSIPDTTAPVITSFTPTSGKKGTVVTIFGSHLTGVFAVRFGGVSADTMVVLSDTVMQAIVDTGATGNVTIFKGFRSATKAGFTFIKDTTSIPDTTAPVITSFTPTSGQQGTIVTIHGKRLNGTFAVRFGGVLADTVLLRDTLIVAIVGTGATGNVSVTTTHGTASKPGFVFIGDSTIGDTSFVYTLAGVENGRITTDPKSFSVYPNPASTYVIWQHPVTDHATRLQLIDITGRVVRQVIVGKAVAQTTVNVNGLNTGVYKLVWIDGKSKLTRTLLVK